MSHTKKHKESKATETKIHLTTMTKAGWLTRILPKEMSTQKLCTQTDQKDPTVQRDETDRKNSLLWRP